MYYNVFIIAIYNYFAVESNCNLMFSARSNFEINKLNSCSWSNSAVISASPG